MLEAIRFAVTSIFGTIGGVIGIIVVVGGLSIICAIISEVNNLLFRMLLSFGTLAITVLIVRLIIIITCVFINGVLST